jgi:putative oxidoreductase
MLLGPRPQSDRLETALTLLRIGLAVLIFIHGAHRAAHWDPNVTGFGEWLSSLGFPMGFYWAAAVTVYELVAPLFLIARRFVTLACIGHHRAGRCAGALSVRMVRRWRRTQRHGIFCVVVDRADRRCVGACAEARLAEARE